MAKGILSAVYIRKNWSCVHIRNGCPPANCSYRPISYI